VHHIVADLGSDRDHGDVQAAEARAELLQLGFDFGEPALVEVNQVNLVHRRDKVLDAQQFCYPGMPTCLTQYACPRVDQKDRDVGVGGTGEHVAGVALMAGCVGQNVAAGGSGEESVGDIDGDALFAFGAQAVGQRGEVGDTFFVGDSFQVVQRQAVGVVQKPPDQGALAVVDRTRGGDSEQLSSDAIVQLGSRVLLGAFAHAHQK
jgi:hypothetical protein